MQRSDHNPPEENLSIPTPVLADWNPGMIVSDLAPHESRVWVVDLDSGLNGEDDQEAPEPDAARALLSADEQARADRFVRPRDRRRFARCRAALRDILGQLLAIQAASVRFRATGHGKPELDWQTMGTSVRADFPPLQFNVSHSAGLALIAVGSAGALGVDVEKVRPVTEAERIVESYFTPAELAAFRSLADDAKAMGFVRGWTRKEAILKGLGIGLAGLAARYETGFGIEALVSKFTPATPSARVGDWHVWDAMPRSSYVAALAIRGLQQQETAAHEEIVAKERVVAAFGQEPVD
jgi:4'-phosphopantetheinyl transferase